jgi:DNA polymerase III sliding clamp (beta) subunit (PCNA family)
MPSSILDGITSKLPIASGKSVTFDDQDGNALKIVSGRMRATVRIMDHSYYPEWGPFDPSDLDHVSDFAARIEQVRWAAQKSGEPPLVGIHLDGEYAIATDHYKIAITPCKAAPLYKPVTIPASIFNPLMKTMGDVRLGLGEGQILVMPDDATQIRASIFANEYPPALGAFKRNESAAVTFRKQGLLEIIDRAMVMGQRDRTPLLKVLIGREEIAVMMTDKEIGLLGDVIETPGFAMHERFTICFTPDNLTSGINAAPNEEITLYYHLDEPLKPVRLDGGSGYEVLIMPRKEASEGE